MSSPRAFPSREEAASLSRDAGLIPIFREIPGDLLTPVAALLRAGVGKTHAFLLESVEGGEALARYSFLGWSPRLVIRARGERIVEEEAGKRRVFEGNVFDRLRHHVLRARPARLPGLPRLSAGCVGYIGWEAARLFERLPDPGRDDLGMDDVFFGVYDSLAAFDHVRQRLILVSSLRADGPAEARRRYAAAVRELDGMEAALSRAPRRPGPRPARGRRRAPRFRSNLSRPEFMSRVERIRAHIRAGDVYQAVLSQRFSAPLAVHPFEVYRALRRINPSPYMYYLSGAEGSLVGSSPEMLLRVEKRRLETRAIAGTQRRGLTEAEDRAFEKALRADEKERAEHLMLVDLARNDIGRVSTCGSVRVDGLMSVERYSHVMHMVTRVTGEMRPGLDALDALAACFPAGTVSGAPKLRAMEILGSLEPSRRGPYAGAVAYLDASGNLDSCITIRTMVSRAGRAHVQAGAGIVADSSPAAEYDETCRKAEALLQAIREGWRS